MPLEKFMLMIFKDIFIDYLELEVSQETETEAETIDYSSYIIVKFIARIDKNDLPVYLCYHGKCLINIYNAMLKRKDKSKRLEESGFNSFALEVTNMLLSNLRKYASQHDDRSIQLSTATLPTEIQETVYSTTRYFKIGGEYLISKY